MRTSKEMITARVSVANPDSTTPAFDALPITPGRLPVRVKELPCSPEQECSASLLAAKRLQREIHPTLTVGPRAPEPRVPGGSRGLARLLELLFRRVDYRHAQLGEARARVLVRRDGVPPLLLLEVRLLDRVEHDLLQVLRQGVPRLLVGHQPLLGCAGQVTVVQILRHLEELHG